MRITIITPCFPYPKRGELTGPERVVENLALSFKKLGHEMKIVTTFWNGGNKYDFFTGIPILRVLDSKEIFGKMGSIFLLNHITFGLNVIRKKNFNFYKDSDVIILPLAICFTKFFKKKNMTVISIFHHYQPPHSISDFYLPIFHYLEKKQFKNHKKVVSVSHASKKEIIHYYRIDPKYIRVIPNGVDINKFNPSNKSMEIRKKYGNNIILNSGLMIKRKRLEVLLTAMTHVIKEIPEVNLIIIGRGPLLNYYNKLSKSLGLQSNVTFLGFVDDRELFKYYASCDIFVFPSELEGFGQVILEAMASGTPVICAKRPPMSKIIKKGGITFNLNDSKDLSKKIIHLLKNKEVLTELRKNALNEAKKYEWIKITGFYLEYINHRSIQL